METIEKTWTKINQTWNVISLRQLEYGADGVGIPGVHSPVVDKISPLDGSFPVNEASVFLFSVQPFALALTVQMIKDRPQGVGR